MVCAGIYSVLVQNIGVGGNVTTAIRACMGHTVPLCFPLFIPDTDALPVPDVTVNTRRGVYVTYEPAQNEQ